MLRPAPAPAAGAERLAGALVLLGAAVGALTGLVGAGGGFLFVPAFVLFAAMPMQRAVGTSLVVIAANALAAFAGHLAHVVPDAGVLVPLAAAAVAGAWLAARGAARAPEARLRRAFGCFLLAVAAWMLARSELLRALF
jgi:uncharacterized membrane protein YfcA